MSDRERTTGEPGAEDLPGVPEVYDRDEDIDDAGLPDADFLGLTPGTANEETDSDERVVPDQA